MAISKVERIVEERLPVRSDVEHDRNRVARIDPCGSSVNRQFADADVNAANTPIADSENGFGVSRYDQIDVVGARLGAE